MSTMASQITSLSIVCSSVCSDADQRKHQSSTSLAFVRGIHRWPVNSPRKGPVTQKMFPFDDIIMWPASISWRGSKYDLLFISLHHFRQNWCYVKYILYIAQEMLFLCIIFIFATCPYSIAGDGWIDGWTLKMITTSIVDGSWGLRHLLLWTKLTNRDLVASTPLESALVLPVSWFMLVSSCHITT